MNKPFTTPFLAHDFFSFELQLWLRNYILTHKEFAIPLHLPPQTVRESSFPTLRSFLHNHRRVEKHWDVLNISSLPCCCSQLRRLQHPSSHKVQDDGHCCFSLDELESSATFGTFSQLQYEFHLFSLHGNHSGSGAKLNFADGVTDTAYLLLVCNNSNHLFRNNGNTTKKRFIVNAVLLFMICRIWNDGFLEILFFTMETMNNSNWRFFVHNCISRVALIRGKMSHCFRLTTLQPNEAVEKIHKAFPPTLFTFTIHLGFQEDGQHSLTDSFFWSAKNNGLKAVHWFHISVISGQTAKSSVQSNRFDVAATMAANCGTIVHSTDMAETSHFFASNASWNHIGLHQRRFGGIFQLCPPRQTFASCFRCSPKVAPHTLWWRH